MTGKIYKLVGYGLTYYGSTKSTLGVRKSGHKQSYKTHMSGKGNYLSSHDILGKGNDWDIELVEEVEDLANLLDREGFYINNNECVNIQTSILTVEERKAYKSQWAKDNRTKINEKYQENKTKINEKRRVHMSGEGMKLKKKEQDAKYRTENKAKIDAKKKAKLPCPTCSKLITASNLKRHMKTHK